MSRRKTAGTCALGLATVLCLLLADIDNAIPAPAPTSALQGSAGSDGEPAAASRLTSAMQRPAGTGGQLEADYRAPAGTVAARGRPKGSSYEASADPTDAPASYDEDYNTAYLFALTRGVAESTLVTPLKPPVFLLTIPLDLVFLPVAAIAGFF